MSEGNIELDAVLDLCRDRHRRIVLAALADQQRPLTVNDLTKTIIKYRYQSSITEVSDETLARVQCSLFHVHVPKLESAGVIDYDPERERVEPTERVDQLQPVLSAIIDADRVLEPPIEL